MEKKDKGFESYEPPKMEIVDIQMEGAVMAMSGVSGYGYDSDDTEFGYYDTRSLNW